MRGLVEEKQITVLKYVALTLSSAPAFLVALFVSKPVSIAGLKTASFLVIVTCVTYLILEWPKAHIIIHWCRR